MDSESKMDLSNSKHEMVRNKVITDRLKYLLKLLRQIRNRKTHTSHTITEYPKNNDFSNNHYIQTLSSAMKFYRFKDVTTNSDVSETFYLQHGLKTPKMEYINSNMQRKQFDNHVPNSASPRLHLNTLHGVNESGWHPFQIKKQFAVSKEEPWHLQNGNEHLMRLKHKNGIQKEYNKNYRKLYRMEHVRETPKQLNKTHGRYNIKQHSPRDGKNKMEFFRNTNSKVQSEINFGNSIVRKQSKTSVKASSPVIHTETTTEMNTFYEGDESTPNIFSEFFAGNKETQSNNNGQVNYGNSANHAIIIMSTIGILILIMFIIAFFSRRNRCRKSYKMIQHKKKKYSPLKDIENEMSENLCEVLCPSDINNWESAEISEKQQSFSDESISSGARNINDLKVVGNKEDKNESYSKAKNIINDSYPSVIYEFVKLETKTEPTNSPDSVSSSDVRLSLNELNYENDNAFPNSYESVSPSQFRINYDHKEIKSSSNSLSSSTEELLSLLRSEGTKYSKHFEIQSKDIEHKFMANSKDDIERNFIDFSSSTENGELETKPKQQDTSLNKFSQILNWTKHPNSETIMTENYNVDFTPLKLSSSSESLHSSDSNESFNSAVSTVKLKLSESTNCNTVHSKEDNIVDYLKIMSFQNVELTPTKVTFISETAEYNTSV